MYLKRLFIQYGVRGEVSTGIEGRVGFFVPVMDYLVNGPLFYNLIFSH